LAGPTTNWRAAVELRRHRPETDVMVLSQYYEEQYALDLIGGRAEGVGYLLKERVGDVESLSTRSPGSPGNPVTARSELMAAVSLDRWQ
jgi:hypothetical protein